MQMKIAFRKLWLAVVCIWSTSTIVFSQSGNRESSLTGIITNAGQPLEGASIVVVSLDKKYKTNTGSDILGLYRFSLLPSGAYIMQVTAVGFSAYTSDTLLIKDGNIVKHNIELAEIKKLLEEVVVQGKKNKVTIENGKLTLNVQNSAVTTGSTAFDLLKNLPGVNIGQEDEIMLRGTAGVNIMLNGKMSYVSGKQLVTLLKSMPAENLSKLELITAPSAEFDAAGNAGIINIVMRKKKAEGYSIDLRSGIVKGRYWMVNQNITALASIGKFSFNGSFDYNTPHSAMKSRSRSSIVENGRPLILERINESVYKINFYTYKLGVDWQLDKRQKLGLQYNGYLDNFTAPKKGQINKYQADQSLYAQMVATNNIVEPYYYDAVNLSHVFDMDSTGKKWTTDAHYIGYRNHSDARMQTTQWLAGSATSEHHGLQSHQPGLIKIISFKTDIVVPYKGYQFKSGVKYAAVSNDNQFKFDSLINGNFEEAVSMSNHFRYKERIGAVYISVSRKWEKTTVEAGLRVEHTYANGYTEKEDSSNTWSYTKPFPSLSVNHKFDEKHVIDITVSRRINRPGYSDLNPVRWYNDPYFYYAGNPALVPEMAWLWSGAYTYKRKYVFTVTYGKRQDYLTRRLIIEPQSQAIKSQSANFQDMERLDFLFSTPLKLTDRWNLQVNVGVNYTTYPIAQLNDFKTLKSWAANLQLQQEIRFSYGLQFEMNAYLYSDELWGLYKKEQVFFVDAGLKKSFWKDKLVLQGSFGDFLRTNRYKGRSQSDVTDYHYLDRPDTHRFGISVRYHIGGPLVSKKANRTEEQERL